ncbi:MAG: cysteine synthase family protein [Lachnospiraceae bacterium]|nr:cysteine synthase family protein [Lachnospiraceae bacterium]
MGKIVTSIEELVGNTPLMELKGYEQKYDLKAHLLAKLEYFNPTGSVKDRAALNMIRGAEEEGLIRPGDTIVEQTSGNTGIGLAAFAIARGYQMEIFLERGASRERRLMLEAYGVKFLDYKDALGNKSEEERAFGWQEPDREATLREIYDYCQRQEKKHYFINQVTNPYNPQAHIQTTGPEIWEDTQGKVDILVCMVGTGGTAYGLFNYLKGKNPNLQIVLAQPDPSSRMTPEQPDVEIIDGVLAFDGIPEEEKSGFVEEGMYDMCINVKTEEAFATARELVKTDGLLMGTSSAAALFAATQLAKKPENEGKNIVIIMPDNGMKYFSTNLFSK